MLSDSQVRQYNFDVDLSFTAASKYGYDEVGPLNPGQSGQAAFSWIVPASIKSFTIVAGNMASSWGGNFTVTIP